MWRHQLKHPAGETTSARCLCWFAVVLAVAYLVGGFTQRAQAFGGVWSSPPASVSIVAERVIVVDNPDATITTIVQLKYNGRSDKLMWIIPTRGHPRVGASSSVVFQRLDYWTTPEYWVEVAQDGQCSASPPASTAYPAPGTQAGDNGAALPYERDTIAVDAAASDPGSAVSAWLAARGYATSERERERLKRYVTDGYNLLAVSFPKGTRDAGLLPPLVLTYEEAHPSLPLSLTASSTRNDVPVHVWLFGPHQAVATNQPSLLLNDARINWLAGARFQKGTLPHGGAGPSAATPAPPESYSQLVAAAVEEAGGQGFVSEMAVAASQVRDYVWSASELETLEVLTKQRYKDGAAALLQASGLYRHWDGWTEAFAGSVRMPAGVTLQQLIDEPAAHRGQVAVDIQALFGLLRAQAVDPIVETSALLQNAPYLTRMATVLHVGADVSDPVFDYNPALAQINQVHTAKLSLGCTGTTPRWQMALPQGGFVAGAEERWPADMTALPANLKVVSLGASGAGTVVTDNSEKINAWSSKAFGIPTDAPSASRLPHDGLLIGVPAPLEPAADELIHTDRASCAVAQVGSPNITLHRSGLCGLLLLAWLRKRSDRRVGAVQT